MIKFNSEKNFFTVETANTSLILQPDRDGRLRILHYGNKLRNPEEAFYILPTIDKYISSSEKRPLRAEFPTREKAYYCEPCTEAVFSDGAREVQLKYKSYTISKTENGEKLEIVLEDRNYPFSVKLNYVIYDNIDLIDKNAEFFNLGDESIKLTKMKSGTLLPEWNRDYRLLTYAGAWGCEYKKQVTNINQGRFCLENTRGTAGSHQNIPFFALDCGDADETKGNVWFGLFQYSGDFRIDFQKDFTGQLTVSAGVNDYDCEIILAKGESYVSPAFTTGFSSSGYERMSETLYDYQYDVLLPQSKIREIFPIIYNTWYPYEFDVDEEKCLGFIEKAKKIGAELFVIDDGWFGRRERDTLDGLGDWYCHKEKFPNGLRPISDKAHSLGMKFGLWVEPEMINIKSDLYKKHPEWVLDNPKIERTQIRNQSILNLAREDVCEFIWETCDRIISEFNLDYLKWDMNAYFTEIGSNDGAFRIKYIENLYRIWDRINKKYPHVLLENCASGGGRADYGLGKYSDRVNRSDNSDPVDVLKLHEGFSTIFLPRLAGGAGNVATNPHHLNGRNTPLKYRAILGMTGSMSVGINILKSDEKELEEITSYISDFKTIRHITQNAYLYRLSSAFENNYTVWEYLARDRKNAVIFIFASGMNFKELVPFVKLRGLDKDKAYKVYGEDETKTESFRIVHGDALMDFGLYITPRGDYYAHKIRIEEI